MLLVTWCRFGLLGGRCRHNLTCILFGLTLGCKKLFGLLVDRAKIGTSAVDAGGLLWKIFGRMSSLHENMSSTLEYFRARHIARGGRGKVFGSFVLMVSGSRSGAARFAVSLLLRRRWPGREWVGDGHVDGGRYGRPLWGNDR